ncbi:MAG: 1-acyl-sn-glycerol-3-phosphate acyltransferase [Thiolinea sp.]
MALLLLLGHVLLGMLLTLWYAGILRKPPEAPAYRRLVQWWLGRIVRIMGGQVRVQGQPAQAGALMVANHVSWLDIPLLGSVSSVRFLSKDDVRGWPVIGWLATVPVRCISAVAAREQPGRRRTPSVSVCNRVMWCWCFRKGPPATGARCCRFMRGCLPVRSVRMYRCSQWRSVI